MLKGFDPENPERFPGNTEAYPGTTLQSVLRACLSRVDYLQNQIPCRENVLIRNAIGDILYLLEKRAAQRHHVNEPSRLVAILGEMCLQCGHTICDCNKGSEAQR